MSDNNGYFDSTLIARLLEKAFELGKNVLHFGELKEESRLVVFESLENVRKDLDLGPKNRSA